MSAKESATGLSGSRPVGDLIEEQVREMTPAIQPAGKDPSKRPLNVRARVLVRTRSRRGLGTQRGFHFRGSAADSNRRPASSLSGSKVALLAGSYRQGLRQMGARGGCP